jgi:hypothetical protein
MSLEKVASFARRVATASAAFDQEMWGAAELGSAPMGAWQSMLCARGRNGLYPWAAGVGSSSRCETLRERCGRQHGAARTIGKRQPQSSLFRLLGDRPENPQSRAQGLQ